MDSEGSSRRSSMRLSTTSLTLLQTVERRVKLILNKLGVPEGSLEKSEIDSVVHICVNEVLTCPMKCAPDVFKQEGLQMKPSEKNGVCREEVHPKKQPVDLKALAALGDAKLSNIKLSDIKLFNAKREGDMKCCGDFKKPIECAMVIKDIPLSTSKSGKETSVVSTIPITESNEKYDKILKDEARAKARMKKLEDAIQRKAMQQQREINNTIIHSFNKMVDRIEHIESNMLLLEQAIEAVHLKSAKRKRKQKQSLTK